MKDCSSFTPDKKLKVTYRIEPGCLGPDGNIHIRKFCVYAEQAVANLDASFIHWHIAPRFSKQVAELRYTIGGKQLSRDKADQYLQVIGKNLNEFETYLQERLAELVDEYFAR